MIQMLEHNAGLRSRIPEQNRFVFEDYTVDELLQIAELFCRHNNYELSDEAREKVRRRIEKEYEQKDSKFGNARFVNNLFKIEVIPAFSRRVNALEVADVTDLTLIKGEEIIGVPEYRQDEVIKEAVSKAAEGVLFLDGDYAGDAAVNEFSAIHLKIEGKIADLHGKCALVLGVCKDSLGVLERLMLPADSPYHLISCLRTIAQTSL